MQSRANPSPVIPIKLLDLAARLADSVLPWALLIAALYLLLHVMTAVSPARSVGDMLISLLSSVSRTRGFAFVFGFCGTAYGLQQRNLRRSESDRLQGRIAALEARVAPGLDSSICPPRQV
jgi:hypothetical protein